MRYQQLTEILMQHYTSGPHAAEAVQAKNEFFDLAGMFDEHSQNFDMKMAQFTDWYLFSRKMNQFAGAPIQHFVETRPMPASDSDTVCFRNLADNRHSLFEFLKLKGNDLHVRDLFSGYKLVIKESPVTFGFMSEEYFQARLIPNEESFMFSTAFCFHPPESNKFLEAEVKRVRKLPDEQQKDAREQLLVRLFRMRNKFDQYRHVGIHDIYSNESRLGL